MALAANGAKLKNEPMTQPQISRPKTNAIDASAKAAPPSESARCDALVSRGMEEALVRNSVMRALVILISPPNAP